MPYVIMGKNKIAHSTQHGFVFIVLATRASESPQDFTERPLGQQKESDISKSIKKVKLL